MKIATFNIQNIFHRDTHLVKPFTEDYSNAWAEEFKSLRLKDRPSEKDYSRMRDLSVLLGFHKASYEPYLSMRRKSGQLYIQKGKSSKEYKANSITNWNGWVKLNTIPISEIAIQNKAKVINDVNPDILVLQEVEDRASLLEFIREYLSNEKELKFEQIIFLETNDNYGRGMGLLIKKGYKIKSMKTHVNDFNKNGDILFDFDFQEYEIETLSGKIMQLLATHLIEGAVDDQTTTNKRKIQSQKIQNIYKNLQKTNNLIAVVGTLNVPCYSSSISPLIKNTDLKDITKHTSFSIDFDKDKEYNSLQIKMDKMGINIKQRDYLMLSSRFFKTVKNCGLNKKGVWQKENFQRGMYKSILKETDAASEHPLLWTEF